MTHTLYILISSGAILASLAIIIGVMFLIKRQVSSSVGAERDQVISKVNALDGELRELLTYSEGYASKKQLGQLQGTLEQTKADLEREKGNLKALEPKLEGAQKSVEDKETHQQELKSAKEEDELKMKELVDNFETISSESISLEQALAQSMKNLDQLMGEATLTADQKAVLQELSNSLSNASSTLRELIVEYETLNERLNMLSQQLLDLEEEYTKLVERQLGE